jgi:hypothetical protein
VSWCRDRQQWQVSIHHKQKPLHLGRFEDEVTAAIRYDEEARRLKGEGAQLNFPGRGEAGLPKDALLLSARTGPPAQTNPSAQKRQRRLEQASHNPQAEADDIAAAVDFDLSAYSTDDLVAELQHRLEDETRVQQLVTRLKHLERA